MQESNLGVLLVSPSGNIFNSLRESIPFSKEISLAYHALDPEQALRKLNGSNKIDIVLLDLSNLVIDLGKFSRQARETKYGSFSGFFALRDADLIEGDDQQEFGVDGVFPPNFDENSLKRMVLSLHDARIRLRNKNIADWLFKIVEVVCQQVHLLARMKRNGLEVDFNKLGLDSSGGIRHFLTHLNHDAKSLWFLFLQEVLIDITSHPPAEDSETTYTGASKRVKQRIENEIIKSIRLNSQSLSQHFETKPEP